MRNRRRHSKSPIDSLRLAIDCMPVATREAMLRGVLANERILVGAYVDERGGVCPMLAAHRCGGRTDWLSFAKSWDRFAREGARKREATPREVRILVDQLRDSLASASGLELDSAIAEHHALVAASMRERHGAAGHPEAVERRRRGALPEQADPRGFIRARRLRALIRAPRLAART